MHLDGLATQIECTSTGIRKGYVVLNMLGALWDEVLYPTERAAWAAVGAVTYDRSGFSVVRATRTIDFGRPA